MTKRLHRIAHEFQARLLDEGGPHRNQMEPVLRDGWATLYRWHAAGERVHRLREEAAPDLAADLRLDTAPVHAAGVCYVLPSRDEWIVLARHSAGEPVQVKGSAAYAFPEPMLTYLTSVEGLHAAGCINLGEQPTWGNVYLPAGKHGSHWLSQDDITEEERRFFAALRYFFR